MFMRRWWTKTHSRGCLRVLSGLLRMSMDRIVLPAICITTLDEIYKGT